MSETNANDKELTVFGFSKGMRAGLITFFLALQTMAIIYLFFSLGKANDKKDAIQEKERQNQAELYEKMIEYLAPTKAKMNMAAEKAIVASDNLDSVTTKFIKQQP